jgi:hypothetical protein
MILCAYVDAGFLNETNSRSCAGAHIFLSENDPFPLFNGVCSLHCPNHQVRYGFSYQISTCGPFCHGKGNDSPPANPHRHGVATTNKTPIQTDNSTAVGVTNKKTVPHQCRASQDQFQYGIGHGIGRKYIPIKMA